MVNDEKVILILDVFIHEENCLLFKDRQGWEKWLRNNQFVYSLKFKLLAGNFKNFVYRINKREWKRYFKNSEKFDIKLFAFLDSFWIL